MKEQKQKTKQENIIRKKFFVSIEQSEKYVNKEKWYFLKFYTP